MERGLVTGLELCGKVGVVTVTVSRGVGEAQPQSCPRRQGWAGRGEAPQRGGDEDRLRGRREGREWEGISFWPPREPVSEEGKHTAEHSVSSSMAHTAFNILVRSVKREREEATCIMKLSHK